MIYFDDVQMFRIMIYNGIHLMIVETVTNSDRKLTISSQLFKYTEVTSFHKTIVRTFSSLELPPSVVLGLMNSSSSLKPPSSGITSNNFSTTGLFKRLPIPSIESRYRNEKAKYNFFKSCSESSWNFSRNACWNCSKIPP